jgi:hypothetical protein
MPTGTVRKNVTETNGTAYRKATFGCEKSSELFRNFDVGGWVSGYQRLANRILHKLLENG